MAAGQQQRSASATGGVKSFGTPYAGLLPDHDAETLEQIRSSLEAEGQKVPIEVDEELNILDGHTRNRLLAERGIVPRYTVVCGLGSDEEKRLYVLRTAGQCRRLSFEGHKHWRAEQKKLVIALRKSDPKRWTQEALADLSQVNKGTISRWLSDEKLQTQHVVNPLAAREPKLDARTKYTPEQVREALQNHANGMTLREAAECAGMPTTTLSSRKREAAKRGTMPSSNANSESITAARRQRTGNGERSPSNGLTPEQDAAIIRLYPYRTWQQLCDELDLTHHQIQYAVKRLGLSKPTTRKANPLEAVQNFLATFIRGVDRHVGEDATQARYGGTRSQYGEALTLVETARKELSSLRKQLTLEQEETP